MVKSRAESSYTILCEFTGIAIHLGVDFLIEPWLVVLFAREDDSDPVCHYLELLSKVMFILHIFIVGKYFIIWPSRG